MGIVLKFMDFCELFPLNLRLLKSKDSVILKHQRYIAKYIFYTLSFQRVNNAPTQQVTLRGL